MSSIPSGVMRTGGSAMAAMRQAVQASAIHGE